MSDPVIITLIIRGALALLITTGGVFCIYQGCRLLFGRSSSASKSTFDATIGGHSISFTAGAAGTAVVFTSILWLGGAVYVTPGLDLADGTKVASSKPSGDEMKSRFASLQLEEFEGEELSKAQSELLNSFISQARSSLSEPSVTLEAYPASGASGASEFEFLVAERRASLLRNKLINEYGLEPSSIRVLSHGERKPIPLPSDGRNNSGRIVINVLSESNEG